LREGYPASWWFVCRGESLNFCLGLCRILPYKTAPTPSEVRRQHHTQRGKARPLAGRASNPQGKTGEKQRLGNALAHGSKKSLTGDPDDVSGKRRTKAKVLVIYRAGFIRSGVMSLIAKSMQFVACGETDEAPMARELFLRHKPDLVLIGLRLCGAEGIQLIKEFRSLIPSAAILALSEQVDAFSAQRAFRAGARGYLTAEDAPELLRALDEISTGRPYVGASVLPLILTDFAAGMKGSRSFDVNSLSDRELEIFSFIGRGLSVSELANELNVSVKTIETHQMRIKEKLALHSAAELRQKAREWLAKSALNRIREDPEGEQSNGARPSVIL
jgi:DNA-binding NarL/FixJ family response regulator